jgi:hypothetical protein
VARHVAAVASYLYQRLLDHVERSDLEGCAWVTGVSRGTAAEGGIALAVELVEV